MKKLLFLLIISTATLLLVQSCARMGAPDGGWYDETPPRVIGAVPADKALNVDNGKVRIYFSEFVKIENIQEKVVISPPQIESPEIKAHGKYVEVKLKDSLKSNMTYTIDFSDAISDNNEGNPLGSYTYSFSTDSLIDTLEVSGYVLAAENLEPIKGILVGLYPVDTTEVKNDSCKNDSLPPFLRVSRSDSRGRFVIRGVAPGRYTVGALQDVDGDYKFTNRVEMMAISHDDITPSSYGYFRQDTVWADAVHVKDILKVPYTHFLPDNVILRAFDHISTDRYFIKNERKDAENFTLYFTAPCEKEPLPQLKGLNFDSEDAFIIESSAKADTITYWLKDTALVNMDTLQIEMKTFITDTLGVLSPHIDTLEILAKTPYAKRLKAKQKKEEEWKEKIEKKLKKQERWAREHPDEPVEPIDTIMPVEKLEVKYDVPSSLAPDKYLKISFPKPLEKFDSAAIHLYVEQDSLWYRSPFTLEKTSDREWEIYADWIYGAEYSFEIDTLAFEDIYGLKSAPYKSGFKVATLESFASLFVNVNGVATDGDIIVQMIDKGDKPVRSAVVQNGTAEFYYVQPGVYYLRAIIDRNKNGKWDTGEYFEDIQPEEVYYNHEPIECKAKWDLTREWNITALPLYKQKPLEITKQRADKEKTIQHRNAQRAAEKGIPEPVQK